MTETEVAVKLENHDQQIKSLKHRMEEQEEQSKVIQDLVLSVKELAINMKNMLDVQQSQGDRLEVLEKEPAKQWSNTKKTFFTSITSSIGTAVAAGILYLISRGGI